jgi:hypothetical protein
MALRSGRADRESSGDAETGKRTPDRANRRYVAVAPCGKDKNTVSALQLHGAGFWNSDNLGSPRAETITTAKRAAEVQHVDIAVCVQGDSRIYGVLYLKVSI